jgi:threonine 3-dehydrogenase
VVAVGSNVGNVKVGERVSGEGHIVCGHCRNCRAGQRHLCRETKGVGVNRDGAFAEYLCIPAANVWHCDPSIGDELYAIFDPFGNATHTALSFNMVGEDVLITGAGPIGIMAAGISKYVGARNVVVVDVNDYRLDLAKKMGATKCVNVGRESLEEAMKELGIDEGFDVGLEMSGAQPAFKQMLNNMMCGGKVSILGLQGKDMVTDWNTIIMKGLTLQGIYGRKMYQTWYQMKHMVQGGLDMEPVITHRYHYTEFEKGFEAMISGMSGKVVLSWDK